MSHRENIAKIVDSLYLIISTEFEAITDDDTRLDRTVAMSDLIRMTRLYLDEAKILAAHESRENIITDDTTDEHERAREIERLYRAFKAGVAARSA